MVYKINIIFIKTRISPKYKRYNKYNLVSLESTFKGVQIQLVVKPALIQTAGVFLIQHLYNNY